MEEIEARWTQETTQPVPAGREICSLCSGMLLDHTIYKSLLVFCPSFDYDPYQNQYFVNSDDHWIGCYESYYSLCYPWPAIILESYFLVGPHLLRDSTNGLGNPTSILASPKSNGVVPTMDCSFCYGNSPHMIEFHHMCYDVTTPHNPWCHLTIGFGAPPFVLGLCHPLLLPRLCCGGAGAADPQCGAAALG